MMFLGMSDFSTEKTDGNRFKPHGSIEFSILEDGIIKYVSRGPFNKEVLEVLGDIEAKAIEEYKKAHKSWCEVVVFKDSCVATEEANEIYTKYLSEMDEKGNSAIATAFVFEEGVEGRHLMRDVFRECHESVGLLFDDFDTLDDALNWVRNELKNARTKG